MYIFSHNPNSEGAKALKEYLGIKRVKNEGSKFKGSGVKVVINWGSSQVPAEVAKCKILNRPEKIADTTNKLKFFQKVEKEGICPPHTTSMEKALAWVGEGHTVVARTILNGSGGAGIVLMDKNNPDKFVKAPLYVKYIPKTEEYRVHIAFGKVIDIQRKTLNKEKAAEIGADNINWKVRNLENGFIYQRANVNPPQDVLNFSIKALAITGLDFGGVDIVVGKKDGKPYVLEINSAPGLQGQTVESYGLAFKKV